MKTITRIAASAALCLCAVAYAQEYQSLIDAQPLASEVLPEDAAPIAPAPAEHAPVPPVVEPKGTVEGAVSEDEATRHDDTISVDFPNEDIRTILRNVADLFDLNLVLPGDLSGTASLKFRNVTWRQIFRVVLEPIHYTFIEDGNIIKVISNETLTAEPMVTELFVLNNANAALIRPTIEGLVDAQSGGRILVETRTNAMLVTERPTRVKRIKEILERLDRPTDQVMIETKFVEVTDRDIRNIGVNWASLQGMQLGAGGLSQTFNRQRGQQGSNSATTSAGNKSSFDVIPQAINPNNGSFGATGTLDFPNGTVNLPQSSVPATAAVSGFKPATVDSNGVLQPMEYTSPATMTSSVENLASLAGSSSTGRLATAVFSASDFNVIVSALKSQNNTKIVSNPTVVTLNNEEAVLNIGAEFPIPSYTYNAERGAFEVSGFEYKAIGIILKVTPQVNAEGVIRLTLEPEVSQQNGSTTFGGAGGAQIPIIATRKVKTQVSLKDGYTAGIGGLIQQSKDHGGSKVPVVGSIPGLGRLFSSKSVNDSTTNLLIFVTAKTVAADGATPDSVFRAEAIQAVSDEAPRKGKRK